MFAGRSFPVWATLRGIGAVGKALAEKAVFGHVLLSGAVPFSASSPD
ncbi:hypothetical protein [uncultured Bilophila sp.]|nr:hypothetical protein [uncultured Bilophila sp.]